MWVKLGEKSIANNKSTASLLIICTIFVIPLLDVKMVLCEALKANTPTNRNKKIKIKLTDFFSKVTIINSINIQDEKKDCSRKLENEH